MLILNAGTQCHKQFFRGENKGYNYKLQVYARLCPEMKYKIKTVNGELLKILPKGEKKINFADKWTTIISLRSNEYKKIKNIRSVQINPKYVEILGNSNHEFDLIKCLSNRRIIVWRNRINGFDFSLTKDFKKWIDIEISSIFPTERWFNVNYLISHIWRVLRRKHSNHKAILILNSECKNHKDIKIAQELGVNIMFAKFSDEASYKDRKILNIKNLVTEITKEIN